MKDNLPDEFYEWLNDCPVQWFRDSIDSEGSSYTFVAPDKVEEVD